MTITELSFTAENPLQVLQTEEYTEWVRGIADPVTKARITRGADRMRRGLFGDWKEIGAGVFEMRFNFGPGFRTYYAKHRKIIVILLGGGEKNNQQKDIANALRLWEEVKNEITQV